MVPVNLKSLVNHLNSICKRSLEAATGLCLSRTHYNVEVEHWVLKLIESHDNEMKLLLRHFDVNIEQLEHDLGRVIDRFKTGNARTPSLAPNIVEIIQDAWLIASLEFHANKIHSGHLLYAIVSDESLSRSARTASSEFAKINPASLKAEYAKVAVISPEFAEAGASLGQASSGTDGQAKSGPTQTPSLDQYTIDLTAQAKNNEIDPVLGRDAEIRQMIDILTRRRQNNPILTGEAGVGKTAVVEGFALRVAQGDVPPALKNISIRSLDMSLLQAGAGVKGEFENRLKSVIEEVKQSPQPIILFIDEAHNLVGAGGQAGQGDAANILKPALARGELRTIAATTWAEYKKYFERDAALTRRFQVVKIDEPSEKVAIEMMQGTVGTLEKHHGVRILDEAVSASVRLSHRYIPARQLPDKSVSLLDTACARVNLSQSATPPEVEDCQRRIEQLQTSINILQRELATGSDHDERLKSLHDELEHANEELSTLTERWQQEKELIGQIRSLRDQLESYYDQKDQDKASAKTEDSEAANVSTDKQNDAAELLSEDNAEKADIDPVKVLAEMETLKTQLTEIQGETPLLHICVDSQAIATVVAEWTGIPVGRMVSDEIKSVLALDENLKQRVIGQDHALETIAKRIHTSRANLTDPKKPIGVFLLAGTSGTGKTETALALAEQLYGGEQNLTTINMSEFKEEHKISMLVGSPPGYVGFGEGGVLTEAVRRKPYSVLLLDEMEKAHPGVQEMFYQVFDKGILMDGEGREIDFKNTLIIMTTNSGTQSIMQVFEKAEETPTPEEMQDYIRPELLHKFKPAFLGRTTIIPYYPLRDEVLSMIVKLQLKRVADRIEKNYQAKFEYSDNLIDTIVERCQEVDTGARNVDMIITGNLLPTLSADFLAAMADGKTISSVNVSIDEEGQFTYDIK